MLMVVVVAFRRRHGGSALCILSLPTGRSLTMRVPLPLPLFTLSGGPAFPRSARKLELKLVRKLPKVSLGGMGEELVQQLQQLVTRVPDGEKLSTSPTQSTVLAVFFYELNLRMHAPLLT